MAVDRRRGSPTLAQHVSKLSEASRLQGFVPEGFAYGFPRLEPDPEVLYKGGAAPVVRSRHVLR
jgi:dTDP-4-dehydrorhamnose 3,5-epimerase-like enzyme